MRVQPSAPPTDTGVTPEAEIVSAVPRKSFQVFGSEAPAFSKAAVLYQTRDLFAALK
ncbi:hypothetical protein STANM309S_01238 [Streptomyces tanashiensis]